ncbi:hypothetical protein D3C73_1383980 [compost metagenome]
MSGFKSIKAFICKLLKVRHTLIGFQHPVVVDDRSCIAFSKLIFRESGKIRKVGMISYNKFGQNSRVHG